MLKKSIYLLALCLTNSASIAEIYCTNSNSLNAVSEEKPVSKTSSNVQVNTLSIPSGRRLRDIAEDKFIYDRVYIGGASHGKLFGTPSIEILNREFNYITPANDFKQTYIHSEPGKWRWELPDQWVDSAELHNQLIRMHSPISPQASKWAKDDSRTAEELETNMTEYMTELCKHYNDEPVIEWMDVVNETVERDGSWFGPKEGVDLWENPWPLIGYDETEDGLNPPSYIRMAFEIANEHAPDIKLIYNQHGDMEDAMWNKTKATVLYLRSLGLRVDGIGWQAHLETDFLEIPNVIEKLKELIDWAHANDLEFHVTENDVDIEDGGDEVIQAEVFATVVKAVLSKAGSGVVSWNAWMIRDSDGKGGEGMPTLFDDNGNAKPAYYAVQNELENAVISTSLSTKVEGEGSINDADGTYLVDSEITLTATPKEGYVFWKWEGSISGSKNPVSFNLDSDHHIIAHFLSEEDFKLVLSTEIKQNQEVLIYPNPIINKTLNIKLPKALFSPVVLDIFNFSGRLLQSETLSGKDEYQIKLDSAWDSGIYLIKISFNNRSIKKKIVIE